MNYYNEFDPKAAAWLRQLIEDKQIPNGHVDTRSIFEVQPSDLSGFVQCHFFAGIGGWSLALRYAGWPEDRPVWTGSCPCQPFSAAGKGLGTADERHLWPVFAELIRQCQPPVVYGEQVASKAGRSWLSGVFADLEGMGYRRAGADLCAAGIGKDHIRQRLFWLADASLQRRELRTGDTRVCGKNDDEGEPAEQSCSEMSFGGMADADHSNESGNTGSCGEGIYEGDERGRGTVETDSGVSSGGMGNTRIQGLQGHGEFGEQQDTPGRERAERHLASESMERIGCRDGKTRRIESGIFPLVDGLPRGVVPSGDPRSPEYANNTSEARSMRLKGYGNAIVPELAAEFIISYMEVTTP